MDSVPPRHGGNLTWAAAIAGCPPEAILDFSASITPLGIPNSVREFLHSEAAIACLQRYPDPNYGALRRALADRCGVEPEWILPGNGAAELLTWLGRDLAAMAAVALPVPAFGDYARALVGAGAAIVRVPLNLIAHGSLPIAALQQTAARYHPCGLLLNTPHNPTGRHFPASDLLPLLDAFDLVAVDEAFIDFLPPPAVQSLLAVIDRHPHVVLLRSLTKFYALPGLRIGYAVAHPERLQRWQQWRDPWSVNALAARAAIACLEDATFQRAVEDWLPPARSHLYAGLGAIPGLHPLLGQANFLLVACDRSVKELQRELLVRDRILIRDCLSFPELGDRYFRVCVRTIPEQERLLAALQRAMAKDGRP